MKEQTLRPWGSLRVRRPWGRDAEPRGAGAGSLEWTATVPRTHGSQPVRGEKAPKGQGCCEPWGAVFGEWDPARGMPPDSLDTPGSTLTTLGIRTLRLPGGKTQSQSLPASASAGLEGLPSVEAER